MMNKDKMMKTSKQYMEMAMELSGIIQKYDAGKLTKEDLKKQGIERPECLGVELSACLEFAQEFRTAAGGLGFI